MNENIPEYISREKEITMRNAVLDFVKANLESGVEINNIDISIRVTGWPRDFNVSIAAINISAELL